MMELNEFDSYFGVCPKCLKNDGCVNVGRSHWFYCKEHRVCWCVGSNLFSSWRYETEAEQEEIWHRTIEGCEDISGKETNVWVAEPPATKKVEDGAQTPHGEWGVL